MTLWFLWCWVWPRWHPGPPWASSLLAEWQVALAAFPAGGDGRGWAALSCLGCNTDLTLGQTSMCSALDTHSQFIMRNQANLSEDSWAYSLCHKPVFTVGIKWWSDGSSFSLNLVGDLLLPSWRSSKASIICTFSVPLGTSSCECSCIALQ